MKKELKLTELNKSEMITVTGGEIKSKCLCSIDADDYQKSKGAKALRENISY